MFKNVVFLFIFASILAFSGSPLIAQEAQPKPEDTEYWEPVPDIVTPGANPGEAPSDAIILFNGENLNEWQSTRRGSTEAGWSIENKAMTVKARTGDIKTKQTFGDCQLHIEWRTPSEVVGTSQGRGNSGIFLQERYELQVLDSYNNPSYVNGQAASIYKQSPPLVNASKGPGEWQTYDVIYKAPIFDAAGNKTSPGRITVFHNGVLVQNNTEIQGTTEYIGAPKNSAHGEASIQLQDHGNPVSYRNIWIRRL